MQKLMIGIVGFVLYCIPARWHYVCQIRNHCEEQSSTKKTSAMKYERVSDIPRSKDLTLQVDDLAVLENYEQFAFLPNDATLQLTADNLKFLDSVSIYLEKNQSLIITGFCQMEEQSDSTSFFDNIGIARAAAVRNYLVQNKSVKENIISLDYQIVNNKTSVQQPLHFNILTEKNKKENKTNYTFDHMTFSNKNFWKDSDKFAPTDNFIIYADSLKNYLKSNPEKTLSIIGHTDNEHAEDYNYGLGLSYANNVVIFFRDKLGVPLEKLDAQSKGGKEPIAPNDNEIQKYKNQRFEIIIN